jgi:hypothetical protein
LKEFLEELFSPCPGADWESSAFAAIGDKLIKKEKELTFFKETQKQQELFGDFLMSLDCEG